MGRPSKLTEAQWHALLQRVLAGEKPADLAREYGVSRAAISVRVTKRAENPKYVASQVVSAEKKVVALTVSEQVIVRGVAADLRAISKHLAGAARLAASTAHRLAGIANGLVERVDAARSLECHEESRP